MKSIRVYLLSLLFWSGVALAAPPSAERGKALYAPCASCHGEAGVAVHPDAPHLAHQPALALTYQLIQFREGRRQGGGMEVTAAHLSDQEIKDVSLYLSTLPAPLPAAEPTPSESAKIGAQYLDALFCNSCHGRQLEGQKHVPRLAGQKASYLMRQLQHFKSGERVDIDGSMENAVQGLDARAIEAISVYAAGHSGH